MGLLTDIFFVKAIKSNEWLLSVLPKGNVYNNVADPDFDMQNVPLPYVIVNNDGGDNLVATKDDEFEGQEDRVTISIRMVARSREELAEMAVQVRRTIVDYTRAAQQRIEAGEAVDGDQYAPYQYTMRFSDISFDMEKPSHSQMFYYDCLTPNETEA